jgi:flagellar biosynthesis protein FlhG
MADQANKLRELIQAAPMAPHDVPDGPPLLVVTGGRSGVGATTVAVNLAAVLADRGARTLLIDAAPRSGMSRFVETPGGGRNKSLSDVLAGRCELAEAMSPGPAGTMWLSAGVGELPARGRDLSERRILSRRNDASWTDASRHSQQRVIAALASLGDMFDVLVVDISSGLTTWTRRFWLRSQLVLLVTTTEGSALLDAYAALKRSVADALGPDVRLVLNRCESDRLADEAQQRFADACQRFLGRKVPSLPSLPASVLSPREAHVAPRLWEEPDNPFGHAMLWLGRAVSDLLAEQARESYERGAQALAQAG